MRAWSLLALPLIALPIALRAPADTTPVGTYVEARTASVYAGACHYNGEYTTQGREAVAGFRVESGVHEGVELAGLCAALLVTSEANLDEAEPRRTRLYLPEDASDAQRQALSAWLQATYPEVLGQVEEQRTTQVTVEGEGESFHVSAGEELLVEGALLPDRACCKMPFNVWYAPLIGEREAVVGRTEEFQVSIEARDLFWSRPGDNCAFVARF